MDFGALTPSLASGSTSLNTNGKCDDDDKTMMMMVVTMTMITMFVRSQVLRPHPHLQLHKKHACTEPDDATTCVN